MRNEILGEGYVFYAEKVERWKGKVLWCDISGEKTPSGFHEKARPKFKLKL